jgi:hypothetical protein
MGLVLKVALKAAFGIFELLGLGGSSRKAAGSLAGGAWWSS